jgi:hypothetical protein
MRAVWEQAPFGGSRLTMLMAIADLANEWGNGFAPIPQLQKRARMGRRTAIRAIELLRRDGWLLKSKRSGKGAVNAYAINLKKLGIKL